MADDQKNPTQAMPNDGLKGAPDGVNDQPLHIGGSSSGSAYPNPHTQAGREGKKDKKPGFEDFGGHGGSSGMGYHGTGQLGDQEVEKDGNPNAGAKTNS